MTPLIILGIAALLVLLICDWDRRRSERAQTIRRARYVLDLTRFRSTHRPGR